MIDLSIVIVNYEGRDLTLRCLESIDREVRSRSGESRMSVEVVVVDNGSTDASVEAVRSSFPWARVIELPRNVGFAKGCNAGLRTIRGRHALLLNNDTIVSAGTLERSVAFLDANPDVGVVGPQLIHEDGRLQNSIHAAPGLSTELLPKALLEWLFPRRHPSKRVPLAGPTDVDAVLGACLFVRGEVLASVGGLPEEYFLFLEETDWCWAIRHAGHRVVHLPDVRLVHLSGASSRRRDAAAKRIEYHRSLYRFLEKRRGAWTARIVRAHRIAKGLIEVTVLAPLVLVSRGQRRRWSERRRLLAWHLRGRPAGFGLAPLAEERS